MNNSKVIGKFTIENGFIRSANSQIDPSDVRIHLYEVLRVINGRPLFWQDHFKRFLKSCMLSDVSCSDSPDSFYDQLNHLIALNQIDNGNIRVDLFQLETEIVLRFSFIPHRYPTADEYEHGVSVGFLYGERGNPHAKAVQVSLRDRSNKLMASENFYEVLLIDHNNLITEGSRSNVFFIQRNCFYTPTAEQVLLGITRMKVMECISSIGAKCIEKEISIHDLAQYDAVFLTGTSPKILPVSRIGAIHFDVKNEFLHQVMTKFDACIANYFAG